MDAIELSVPWFKDGSLTTVSASLLNGVWSGYTELVSELNKLHLESGHHPDRDMELGMKAAKIFGGRVRDNRPPVHIHKMAS